MDGGSWSGYSSANTVISGGPGGLGPGSHTIYVRAKDETGNTDASPAERSWTIDTAPPIGTLAIDNGAASTSGSTVSLTLSASDPSGPGSGVNRMHFRNADSARTAWEPYATTRARELSAGSGTKTVYVQYTDRAGNVSTTVRGTISYLP